MTTMTAEATKTCTGCKRDLPLTAFARIRADKPWLRSKCRECVGQAYPWSERKGVRRG